VVMEPEALTCRQIVIGESDLYVCGCTDLEEEALESLGRHRSELEEYLAMHVSFGTAFRPVPVVSGAPDIVADMGRAAEAFDVGPMASVAGAIAQHVGTDLLARSPEVIIENGGDIFMAGGGSRRVRVFAGGEAPLVHVTVEDSPEGVGLCTSSGTVWPSVSLGSADAVTVLARTSTLADAAATALGNLVLGADDIEGVLRVAADLGEVLGVVLVAGGSVGAWGAIELS
jgi:ApbE superfamily uncharacterized protein (UPF0280 family)